MTAQERFNEWKKHVTDPELAAELCEIDGNCDEIKERFYGDLEFGTGGLRGVIGAGSARMNILTVGKATQGFADYINNVYSSPSVCISYDSRIKSDVFARHAATIFAANGIKVFLFDSLRPTPVLSFAVRHLHASGGVMVTASHNPSKYNGYKAYSDDGCQLLVEASRRVINCVDKVDIFSGVKTDNFEKLKSEGKIVMVGEEITEAFLDAVLMNSLNPEIFAESSLKLVYTPLNGTGLVPNTKLFSRLGLRDVTIVENQKKPDGNFPTCPFPNPEIREALNEGLKICEKTGADLLLATDPDADRVGIAVRNRDGSYKLISGNEVGCLMVDYVLGQLTAHKKLPHDPVVIKTIVTSTMSDKIAAHYGVKIRDVYTGFKYIGSIATELEKKGELNRFIMGYEESYGYCVGAHVRDKDSIVSSMIICEMAAFYKKQGKTLLDRLCELYDEYGYYINEQKSFVFEGVSGMETMAGIMEGLRTNPPESAAGQKITCVCDYKKCTKCYSDGRCEDTGLPSDNVLAYTLCDSSSLIVRPSGTEPKLKLYLSVCKESPEKSRAAMDALKDDFSQTILSHK